MAGDLARSTSLHIDGVPVARYVVEPDLDETLSPRPYLHPVRTLGGQVTTDCLPDDHPWHLGAGVAVQDVSGANFWGGPTYVRGEGYVLRADHGRIDHLAWEHRAPDGFVERLRWAGHGGGTMLTERRSVRASRPPGETFWVLDVSFALHNEGAQALLLGSPATNGRVGAGYGGFFWRAAREPSGSRSARVFTAVGHGEDAVLGSRAPWLALTGSAGAYTLVFAPVGEPDPWFVRAREYPGVCCALAFSRTLTLPPGGSLERRVLVAVCDGAIEPGEVSALLDTARAADR